jgi:NitT/TauT family transport system substrate-binding protein
MWMRIVVLNVLLIVLLAACNGESTAAGTPVGEAGPEVTPEEVTLITLPMGYIPDPQFAPIYVAVDKGYFAAEGLQIEFEYSFETDGLALVGAGHLPFASASGEQALLARAQALPVVYVTQWFQRFPVAVVSKATAAIEDPTDLRGRRVGIPGFFGATYVGYAGLLFANDLTFDDVVTEEVGFVQVEVLLANRVDAAVVYANNEPVQLAAMGEEINVFYVADYANLVANGIVTNERTIADNPDLVQGFVRATLRGLADTLAQPEEAYEISKKYIDGLDDGRIGVLAASLDLWRAETLGLTDPAAWRETEQLLLALGLLDSALDNLDAAYTNRFVEAAQLHE